MQKKNKVMLAAAIGMVAIVIGCTAVRCSLATRTRRARQRQPPSIVRNARGPITKDDKRPRTSRGLRWAEGAAAGQRVEGRGRPREDGRVPRRSFVETDGCSVKLTVFDVRGRSRARARRTWTSTSCARAIPTPRPHLDHEEEGDGSPLQATASRWNSATCRAARWQRRRRVGARRSLHGPHRRKGERARIGRRIVVRGSTRPRQRKPRSTARCTWT